MQTKIILDFLQELTANNNREWFHANKKRYETARTEMINLLNVIIPKLKKEDKQIGVVEPKESMFRIYRDIRFSNDKRPYKTNFGAAIGKGGRKSEYASYYIHLEPANSFIGGGIWHPSATVLKAVRKEIYFNADEFKEIIQSKEFTSYFGSISGDKLIRPPKDFPKDFPDIELLKFKDYTAMHAVPDNIAVSDEFADYVVDVFKAMKPLNHFINRAIETEEN